MLDVTDLAHPRPVSTLPLANARNIYLARTYAYVAAGPDGLVILDIERPAQPRIDQVFTADGAINDLNDVKLGITYVERVCLPRRRAQRSAGGAAHLARDAGQQWVQSTSDARIDRVVQAAAGRQGPGDLQGSRSRPGR